MCDHVVRERIALRCLEGVLVRGRCAGLFGFLSPVSAMGSPMKTLFVGDSVAVSNR